MTKLSNVFDNRHNSCAVIGAQWGDEGKGKITDILSEDADVVVRWQGGPNAGHTIVIDGEKNVTHGFPSGVFREDVTSVIARGCVVNPIQLCEEAEDLSDAMKGEVLLDPKATVITPWHRTLDKSQDETEDGGERIGTTNQGIGPAYQSRSARVGLLVGDLKSDDLSEKISRLHEWAEGLAHFSGVQNQLKEPYQVMSELRESLSTLEENGVRVEDTPSKIRDTLDKPFKKVLFEGAQGSMLDLYHGVYPYVTSSSPTANGIPAGTGVPPDKIGHVLGVTKSYTTRVGGGQFPCEEAMEDEVQKKVREVGGEYGATTGRPRRCGWLDIPALRYSTRLNGFYSLVVTKADILSSVNTPKIVTDYNGLGSEFWASANRDETPEIEVEEMEGWSEDITGIRDFLDLPEATIKFVKRISAKTGTPLSAVSVGPNRREIATK